MNPRGSFFLEAFWVLALAWLGRGSKAERVMWEVNYCGLDVPRTNVGWKAEA